MHQIPKQGPPCGHPHPDLAERVDLRGEAFTPLTCQARSEVTIAGLIPHANKHRARLGKHLVRWN